MFDKTIGECSYLTSRVRPDRPGKIFVFKYSEFTDDAHDKGAILNVNFTAVLYQSV